MIARAKANRSGPPTPIACPSNVVILILIYQEYLAEGWGTTLFVQTTGAC